MWLLLACTQDPTLPTGDAPPSASGETAGTGDTADDTGETGTDTPTDTTTDTGTPAGVVPPLGGTSGGSGGADHPAPVGVGSGGDAYVLLAPSGSAGASAVPLLLVYSGTEGAAQMMLNLQQLAPFYGFGDALVAVLDGRTADANAGAAALDELRAQYDVDNDRTWLLSESAGTTAGLELGLSTRQSYFAAYWVNDVNARRAPALDATALGFAPWGNAGPGGDLPDAAAIVDAMRVAGYRLPADAPYSGPGSTTHGATPQFLAAVGFLPDKSRD